VLFLRLQAVVRLLEHVHFELHLCVLLLSVLHFVTEQVERVLDLLSANVVFLQLTPLDGKLALGRLELFALLRDLSLVLRLRRLQLRDLVRPLLQPLIQHLDILHGVVLICEDALVASFEISVRRVHVVEFGLEFETQLNLFFMVLRILREVLLQLETHLFFVHHFSLKFLAHLLLGVQVLLQHLLVIGLLFRLLLVVTIELLQSGLVLFGNLTDKHAVICAAAIFKQDGKDFPNVRDQRVLFLRVLQAVLNQLVKSD